MIYRIVWSISVRFHFSVTQQQQQFLLTTIQCASHKLFSSFSLFSWWWPQVMTTYRISVARHFSVAGKHFRCYRTMLYSGVIGFKVVTHASKWRRLNSQKLLSAIFWFDSLMNFIRRLREIDFVLMVVAVEWKMSNAKWPIWRQI